MGSWTLESGGTETTLAEWGLTEDVIRQRINMAPDTVTIRAPGPMDAALEFAFGAAVIIRRDRTGVGPFAGGSIYFQGKAGLPKRHAGGNVEGISYQFSNPWWDLTRLVFQQEWDVFNGWTIPDDPTSPPTFTTYRSSELFLGQTAAGVKQHAGAQILEALNWAIACGVNLQVGTIDVTTDMMIYHIRDVTVAEVIKQLLRPTPDVTCWFDYATTPPTIHLRKLANLVNVPIAIANTNARGVDLVPRHDLVLPAVCIRYKNMNTIDGAPWVVVTPAIAPGGATGTELGAAVHTIELAGFEATNLTGELKCTPVTAQGDAAARVAFWKRKDPLFNSLKLTALSISAAQIEDDDGNAVSLVNFPNELEDGSVADWMTIGGVAVNEVHVTVKALAEYDLYREDEGWDKPTPDGFVVQKGRTKELSCRIKLTNGITGVYQVQDSYTEGEPVPVGLETAIYNAHQVLQYQGKLELVGEEIPDGVGIGNTVTINTETASYPNCLVQQVTEDLGRGVLALQLGPAAHLGLADMVELLRVNRYRLTIKNPATRNSGTNNGGGNTSVGLGNKLPKENTTTGMGGSKAASVNASAGVGLTAVVKSDAENKKLVLEVVDANGARDATQGSFEAALSRAMGTEIKIREAKVCEPGGTKYVLTVCSATYADKKFPGETAIGE
jgi:hypothetical protein